MYIDHHDTERGKILLDEKGACRDKGQVLNLISRRVDCMSLYTSCGSQVLIWTRRTTEYQDGELSVTSGKEEVHCLPDPERFRREP